MTVDCPNCGTHIRVNFVDVAGSGRLWSWGLADYTEAWEDSEE